MFAIMGATGQTGGHTARALLKRGAAVRAIVRDAAKAADLRALGAEVTVADAQDPRALAAAFAGVSGVYAINPPSPTAPDAFVEAERVGRAVAQALDAAAVPHVVLLSSEGAHLAQGSGIIRTARILEDALSDAAGSRTFLRPTFFMENWAAGLALAREQGILPSLRQPLDQAIEGVCVADVGAVAANLLLEPASGTRIVHLLGPDTHTPEEVARHLARLLGRPVAAVAPPREAWEGAMTGAGLSAGFAAAAAEMYEGLNAGRIRHEGGEIRRGTVTVGEALAALTSGVPVRAAA